MKDPNSVLNYSGEQGTVGAKQNRNSTMRDVGAGDYLTARTYKNGSGSKI